jgi:hypothetical protein
MNLGPIKTVLMPIIGAISAVVFVALATDVDTQVTRR